LINTCINITTLVAHLRFAKRRLGTSSETAKMTSSSFSPKYLLGIVRRRLYLFLIPFVLVASLGTVLVMSLPAVYSSSAKILVETQQIPEDLVKSTITALASERIQVIQQRVLTRQNLLLIVDKFSLFKSRSNLSKTDLVDLMRQRIVFAPVELEQGSQRRNTKITTAFTVEFSYENAETAMKVANELLTFILEEDIKSRTERASDTSKFLERENQRISTELATVQNQISDFKLQNNDTLPEKLSFNMSLLERTERITADLQRELISNDDQQRLVQLEATLTGATNATVPIDPLDAIKKKLNEAKIEYEVKKSALAESHPDMRALKQAIATVEAQVAAAPPVSIKPTNAVPVSNLSALAKEKLQSLQQTQALLQQQKAKQEENAKKLRAVVIKTPEAGATLAVLERKEAALQRSLDDMSQRYSQARLGERLEQDQRAEKFEVIEQPVLPLSPSKPNRPSLLGAVAAAAVGLGAMLSTGAELLDQTIRSSADIEKKLRQRPLVVIPYIKTLKEKRRNRWTNFGVFLTILAIILIALFAIHHFYRPLDELYYKYARLLPF
jgi:polysaccharide biosynthesis transport protein